MGCYEQCVLREKEGLLAKSSGESFAILQGRSLRRALFSWNRCASSVFLLQVLGDFHHPVHHYVAEFPRISMGLTIAQLSARLRCAECGGQVRSLSRGDWETWLVSRLGAEAND